MTRRERLMAAITVLAGLVGSFAVAEIALRLGGYEPTFNDAMAYFNVDDPVLGYRGRPNAANRFRKPQFDVLVRHDARGFRLHESAPPADPGARVLAVIGDSFTWGWGVGQGQVYTDRLQALLPRWRIENMGVSGLGTVSYHRLVQTELRSRLRVGDAMLVTLYYNDFSDNLSNPLRARVEDGRIVVLGPVSLPRSSPFHALSGRSHAVNLIDRVAYEQVERWFQRRAARDLEISLDAPEVAPGVAIMRHFMAALGEECRTLGVDLTFLLIPDYTELGEAVEEMPADARVLERDARTMFLRLAGELGVPVIDLLPVFLERKRAGAGRMTFRGDRHWTAPAHEAAAQAIARRLCAAGGC